MRWRRTVCADEHRSKQGRLVPICHFCSVSFQPRAKMLVGNFPKPFSNCIHRMQAARSFKTLPSPYKQEKHAKGRCKIDLWRVLFTGSAAGPLWAFLLPESVSNSAAPAKAAASRRGPCGIPGRPLSSA